MVSFHLGAEICAIDLEAAIERLGPEALRAAEAHGNDLVLEAALEEAARSSSG
jgi:hypothetical protein